MRLKHICLLSIALISPALSFALDPSVINVDNPWLVLRAFLVAYPEDIEGVDYDFQRREWFMSVGEKRLYWAEGRLLPAAEIAMSDKWRPYVDYLYPEEIPNPATFTEDTIRALDADALADNRSNSPSYNFAFYDALYDGRTRRRIESHIVRFDYLGLRVSVHQRLVPALKRVESRIVKLSETDEEVRAFLSSIASIEGYNWREIADSPSRSNHSWGIAVDILPRNWKRKNIYWNWVSTWNDRWMLIPLERRWTPPAAVVEAFEREGFVWGGKWLLWDNMHFEYRPELLVLQKWGHKGDLKAK